MRRIAVIAVLAALGLLIAAPAFANPGAPNFGAAIYADGQTFGTKGTTSLPAPNGHNNQSFDNLYRFTNSNNPDQLAVAEAAPGPGFNGGRWAAQDVTWSDDAINAGTVPLLTSEADVLYYEGTGDLTIVNAHDYFQCPLLPTK